MVYSANTTRSPNAGLMLAHRLRRWTSISPALSERVVIAGVYIYTVPTCGHLAGQEYE